MPLAKRRLRWVGAAVVGATIAACGSQPRQAAPAAGTGAILIPASIPYADGVGSESVRNECDFPTRVSRGIVEAGAARGLDVRAVDGDLRRAKGRVLTLRTVLVHTLPGGSATWSKYAQIHGELREGGRLVGDFDIRRVSMGIFHFGACGALGHVGDAIAADIALWLKNPQFGTRKGVPRDS